LAKSPGDPSGLASDILKRGQFIKEQERMKIPSEHLGFFEKASFAHLATVMEDGSPHTAPVWVGYDGDHILTAGARSHRRHRNIGRDPRVSLSILDPDNPYHALFVRGEVVEMLPEGGIEFLDEKARLHWGTGYPFDRDLPRFLVKIRPDEIVEHPPRTP
jgi:PPOX class probable F420-dependent enzyme